MTEFAVEFPPEVMRFTAGQVGAMVDGAVRSGKIPPWRRGYFAARMAEGGRAAGEAVTTLLQLTPADPVTASAWDHDPRSVAAGWPGDNSAADNSPEAQAEVYERLYPGDELAAAVYEFRLAERGRAASRFSNWQHRHDNTLQAAGRAGPAHEPVPGHGAMTVEHAHEHSHDGTVHTHRHVHRADARHAPGPGHRHLAAASPDDRHGTYASLWPGGGA